MLVGDILADGPTDAIQVTNMGSVEVGGTVYGNLIARNWTSLPAPSMNMQVTIDGDIDNADIINNHGNINSLTINGSVISNTGRSDIWSSSNIGTIQVAGSFDGRVGENDEGLSGHPNVFQLFVNGDFASSYPMEMLSLSFLDIGGDLNAEIAVSTAMGSDRLPHTTLV